MQDSSRQDASTKDGTASGALDQDGLHLRGATITTTDSRKVALTKDLPPLFETLTVTWDLTIQ